MEEKQSIFCPGNGVDVLEGSYVPISQVNKCFQEILNSKFTHKIRKKILNNKLKGR